MIGGSAQGARVEHGRLVRGVEIVRGRRVGSTMRVMSRRWGRDSWRLVLFVMPGSQTGLRARLLIYGRLLRILRVAAILFVGGLVSSWRTAARHGDGEQEKQRETVGSKLTGTKAWLCRIRSAG